MAGVWTADVEVDQDQLVDGRVTIEIEGVSWIGVSLRAEHDFSVGRYLVLGGAGGMTGLGNAQHYVAPTVMALVTDIMREAHEVLDPASDPTVLAMPYPQWHRVRANLGSQLQAVMPKGYRWRVTRAGLVRLDPISFAPDASDPGLRLETGRDPGASSVTYSVDEPVLTPGAAIDGKDAVHVVTTLDETRLEQEIFS